MRRQSKTAKRKIRSAKRTKAPPDISLRIRSDQESDDFTAGDQIVRLTNPRKVFWPDPGIPKRDLLQFYIDLAPVILPHLSTRPMVMKRYPNGIAGDFF